MSNQAHFEVFQETREARRLPPQVPARREPTGQYRWRFKAANGQITATSGEGFTRREDAHRSIEGLANDLCQLIGITASFLEERLAPHIVDLDENGKVIA